MNVTLNHISNAANSFNVATGRETFFIDGCSKKNIPFDTRKDAAIIGRGSESGNKFTFDLKRVNIFYLNRSPGKNLLDRYIEAYGIDTVYNSIFSFVHASHYKQLLPSLTTNVISWKGRSITGIICLDVFSTAADWIGFQLYGKNIYLMGTDFDKNGRKFMCERDGLKIAMQRNGQRLDGCDTKRNKYIFLTANRYFHNYMDPEKVRTYVKALLKSRIIKEV